MSNTFMMKINGSLDAETPYVGEFSVFGDKWVIHLGVKQFAGLYRISHFATGRVLPKKHGLQEGFADPKEALEVGVKYFSQWDEDDYSQKIKKALEALK